MPTIIVPASHEPKPHPEIEHAADLGQFLHYSCPDVHYSRPDVYAPGETKIHATSFDLGASKHYPSESSFVRAAIEAWGRHSHLVLRPEDIWFTILVQMNFFMEANADKIRHLFVAHERTETIKCLGADWTAITAQFQEALPAKLKTPWMLDWVLPKFSTSTEDDNMVATVLMMGLMKGYFKYSSEETCGIPSITLLGEKNDWQRLLDKVERLSEFGEEPQDYASRLRPILTKIKSSFDDPKAISTRNFWDGMVQAKVKHSKVCGTPPVQYMLNGWILGFFYWYASGRKNHRIAPQRLPADLETISYGDIPLEQIPVGYAKAKFTLNNMRDPSGDPLLGHVVAGNIGNLIVRGAPEAYITLLPSLPGKVTKEEVPEMDVTTGCFGSLRRSLRCFSHNHSSPNKRKPAPIVREKSLEKGHVSEIYDYTGHSTIRPLSGWFLISPAKDLGPRDIGPFVDCEEIDGRAVDAINSCSTVEHYSDGR